MFRLKESMHVNAPIDRCFLLSTSIDLVRKTLGMTPHPIAGTDKVTGLIVAGDRLLWRGWKFGLPAMHETLITGYERPHFFQDSMARGRFRRFYHDHRFDDVGGQTLMVDVVHFSLPGGVLGRQVARRIVAPHILGLLQRRFALLKRIAEGPDWEQYVHPAALQTQSTDDVRSLA